MSDSIFIQLDATQQTALGASGDGEEFLFLAFPGAHMERFDDFGLAVYCATYYSDSVSESTSYSTSESPSISTSNSVSDSNSTSQSPSISTSNSVSDSNSTSQSPSISTSNSVSDSNSTSQSPSISTSNSNSISTSDSNSISLSNSNSLSSSNSNSVSDSNSHSHSLYITPPTGWYCLYEDRFVEDTYCQGAPISTVWEIVLDEADVGFWGTCLPESGYDYVYHKISGPYVTEAEAITACSESTSDSVSDSTSDSVSTSNSVSNSNSVSTSDSVSTSNSVSNSISNSNSVSVSNSNSVSASNSDSVSNSVSVSESNSTSHSASVGGGCAFSDDFNDNSMDAGWSSSGWRGGADGTWVETGQKMTQSVVVWTMLLRDPGPSCTDMYNAISGAASGGDNRHLGLVGRWTDDDNHVVAARYDGGASQARLWNVVAGTANVLASANPGGNPDSGLHEMKIDGSGSNNASYRYNGSTLTGTTANTGTKWGIVMYPETGMTASCDNYDQQVSPGDW